VAQVVNVFGCRHSTESALRFGLLEELRKALFRSVAARR
jgi:hypothetical protein